MTKITLVSSDGQPFEVEKEEVDKSNTIKLMIEDAGVDDPIPLPDVNSNTLTKVIEYSKFHVAMEARLNDDEVNAWDAEFVKKLDGTPVSIGDMILAAIYLDIKPLLDVTCQAAAIRVIGTTPEEFRANSARRSALGDPRRPAPSSLPPRPPLPPMPPMPPMPKTDTPKASTRSSTVVLDRCTTSGFPRQHQG
jgi:S-phase kinase-associated protein 1